MDLRPTVISLLLCSVASARSQSCPSGMVPVGSWCLDKYEASINTASDCKSGVWLNQKIDTLAVAANGIRKNGEIVGRGAYACSSPDAFPARWITWFQAATLCARSGKELVPDKLWVTAAIGTPKEKCTVNQNDPQKPNTLCVSQWGAVDMIGNLWEWTDAWLVGGRTSLERNGRPFDPASSKDGVWPAEYCDPEGVKCTDTIWGLNGEAGLGTAGLVDGLPAGVIRGGNFKMKEAAGVLTMSLNASPAHFRETTGFRCALRK